MQKHMNQSLEDSGQGAVVAVTSSRGQCHHDCSGGGGGGQAQPAVTGSGGFAV